MSTLLERYYEGVVEYHALTERLKDDEEALYTAEELQADRLDALWDQLTEEEREEALRWLKAYAAAQGTKP